MNFTREPIIETVITPREGCKLVIRSSKANGGEDYFVDAVEVVSFGHSFFFRSQERPKSFLVPVSDYEVLELKETRMVLKNVSGDKSIKIGGGKTKEDPALAESRPAPEREPRKRGKSRRSRRSRSERPLEKSEEKHPEEETAPRDEPLEVNGEIASTQQKSPAPEKASPAIEDAPSFISKLFPPPPTLIKESLSRYKPAEEEEVKPVIEESIEEKADVEETIFEHPTPDDVEKEDETEQ